MPQRVLTAEKWKPSYNRLLSMVCENKSRDEMAKALGLTTRSISSIINTNYFQERLSQYSAEIREKSISNLASGEIVNVARSELAKAAIVAAKLLIETMNDPCATRRVRFEAAKEILYQNGIKPIDVIETRERVYTLQEAQQAKQTMAEILKMNGRDDNPASRFILDGDKNVVDEEIVNDFMSPLTDESSAPPPNFERETSAKA